MLLNRLFGLLFESMPRCWNGIQVRLRCVCRKAWEFESPPGYHKAEKRFLINLGAAFRFMVLK